MREQEKKFNFNDDKKNITGPVITVVVVFVLLILCLIWFGIKNRAVYACVRDLVITLTLFVFFIFNTILAILGFILSNRVNNSKDKIDELSEKADITIEELADKITNILLKILQPVINMKSNEAGFLRIFSKGNKGATDGLEK